MTDNKPGEDLKEVLRRYPTGVTVVTSLLDGEYCGGTMNSFTSVSLNPPLIGLFITTESRTAKAVRQTKKFVVNILREGQEDEAKIFANDKSDDKFSGIKYHLNGNGVPVLDDALGSIECSLYKEEEIADHFLFVGEVEKATVLNDEHALVYHKRGFKSTVGLTQ
ncbi:hypothetical protein IX51_03490 [uncultured archaeon]|nr:hypothetical protein IX51_03490 [uncultured archaeon]HKJ97131.1 flavin reductase family protein [Thermoplasmataceae archaeon]